MALLSNLYNKEQFNTPENLILNANIYEYDIIKCNVSVLRAYGSITEEQYNNFCEMPKQTREEIIGRKMREENTALGYSPTHKMIQAGKTEAKEKLFDLNNITDDMVVRVASDAVMVNTISPFQYTTIPIGTGYGTVTFKQNGPWNSYIRLHGIMVFLQKMMDGNYDISVKGINDNKLPLHEAFLSFITQIVSLMEIDKNSALRFFKDYYDRYVNMDLPINNYREFNAMSSFRVSNCAYAAVFLDEVYKEKLDINHNLCILRDIYRMILKLPS